MYPHPEIPHAEEKKSALEVSLADIFVSVYTYARARTLDVRSDRNASAKRIYAP